MYPQRKRSSRLRRLIGRLPLFIIGVMLATAVGLLMAETGAVDSRQMGHAGLQAVALMGLMSMSTISIGSILQLANRSSLREVGIAGMGIGLLMTLFMAMFASSI